MRTKEQTIILTAAVMTLFLIGSVLSNATAAYAKTSHHNSKGNASAPSNQTSSNSTALSLSNPALSLTNPALNNLQPPGGGGQNNTNPPNQAIVKTLPGLTQLIPGG